MRDAWGWGQSRIKTQAAYFLIRSESPSRLVGGGMCWPWGPWTLPLLGAPHPAPHPLPCSLPCGTYLVFHGGLAPGMEPTEARPFPSVHAVPSAPRCTWYPWVPDWFVD